MIKLQPVFQYPLAGPKLGKSWANDVIYWLTRMSPPCNPAGRSTSEPLSNVHVATGWYGLESYYMFDGFLFVK